MVSSLPYHNCPIMYIHVLGAGHTVMTGCQAHASIALTTKNMRLIKDTRLNNNVIVFIHIITKITV